MTPMPRIPSLSWIQALLKTREKSGFILSPTTWISTCSYEWCETWCAETCLNLDPWCNWRCTCNVYLNCAMDACTVMYRTCMTLSLILLESMVIVSLAPKAFQILKPAYGSSYKLPNCNCSRVTRSGKRGGGVSLLVHAPFYCLSSQTRP